MTDTTAFRRIRVSDVDAVAEYCADRDLAWMTARIPHPYDHAMAESFCAFCQTPESTNLALTLDDAMIGMVGYNKEGESADIGYWVGAPHTGKDHATRAVKKITGSAFSDPEIKYLTACVFQDNPASARVLYKAGFNQTGDCKGPSIARGLGTYPTWTFKLKRTEWNTDEMTGSFRPTRSHLQTPVLKTARLTLRPFREADAGRLLELINDLDVARMLAPVPHPYTPELAAEWVSGAIWNPDDIHFVLDDGTGLIGACGLGPSRHNVPMIGFWLGRRYWGQGLMSEAVLAMLDWAINTRGEVKLISFAFVDNPASQRIHEKAGFIAGETVEQRSAARGEPVDAISYTLERDDWQVKQ